MNAAVRTIASGLALRLGSRTPAAFLAFAIFSTGVGTPQIVYEFNFLEELTENFSQNGSPAPSEFYSSMPGVGGTAGRLNSTGSGLFLNSAFDLLTTSSLQFSTFFSYVHFNLGPSRQNSPFIRIGFSESLTNGLYPLAAAEYVWVAIVVGSDGETRKLGLESKDSGQGAADIYSDNFPLASGLYELEGTWTRASSSAIDFTARLISRGNDGTGPAIELASLSGELPNASIAADSSIFAAINATRGPVEYIDNVSIVPEPAPYALLVPGLFLLGAFANRYLKARQHG